MIFLLVFFSERNLCFIENLEQTLEHLRSKIEQNRRELIDFFANKVEKLFVETHS